MTNIDHRETFNEQYAALREFPMFQKMEHTVEDSPWHREKNVLVHTDMVVEKYVEYADDYDAMSRLINTWNRDDYLGAISCAFHDTGKPDAEIEKFSEARGKYRAYHGHELLSAHKWQDYAAQRSTMFNADEIFRIMWMIEYHMPWSTEDKTKREQMAKMAKHFGAEVYINALMADQFGRISDDAEAKELRVRNWVREFMELVNQVQLPQVDATHPFAILPIAPSGAGKSTYLKKIRDEGRHVDVFSLDLLRHEFYDADDYARAYQFSIQDKSFEARANARFHQMVKEASENGHDLYIDNTNLSAKRRKWYLDIVRKHGFQTRAVLMPAPLNTLLERQKTRGDKTVPDNAVRQQYKSLQTPMLGEFDEIVVSDHNMKKHP